MSRWQAVIEYKKTPSDIYLLEELEELQDIIEKGPCFNSIKNITITIIDNSCEKYCECGAFDTEKTIKTH